MWVVESAFEGSKEPYKKLVKPGTQYDVGRKPPAKLILTDKTVSRDSGSIEVDKWSQSQSSLTDVNYSADWPKIRLNAGKKLVRVISRDDEERWKENPESFIGEEVEPNKQRELEDGDLVIFTKSSPPIRIVWEPLLFWVAPDVLSLDDLRSKQKSLAPFGIPIVESPNIVQGASHLVTKSASPTVQLLEALVAESYVVTDDYIDEVIQQSDTLELELSLPSYEDYFPPDDNVDDITYEEIKSKSKPDGRRKLLLKGMTILFASADDDVRRTFKNSSHAFQAAGAHIEVCSTSSLSRFTSKEEVEQYLETKQEEAQDRSQSSTQRNASSSSQKSTLVIITSTTDTETPWYKWFASVSRRLSVYMPESGLKALQDTVLLIAPSRFLTKLASEEFEEEEVEEPAQEGEDVQSSTNNAEEEVVGNEQRNQSMEQSGSVPPTEQVEQRAHSPAPPTTAQNQFVVPPTPSRRPKRRAGLEKVNPFDDLFGSLSTPATKEVSSNLPVESQSSIPPTQQQQHLSSQPASSKPRRNVTRNKEQARRSEIWQSIFEDSGNDAMTNANPTSSLLSGTGQTQERYTRRFRQQLEDEERQATQRSQARTQAQTQDPDTTVVPRSNKRVAEEEAQDERDMINTQQNEAIGNGSINASAQSIGPTQQRTQQGVEYIAERPSNTATEVSKDDRFLQSLMTLKKSKKNIDAFDKEFDRLRIAKPIQSQAGSSKNKETTMLVRDDELEDPDFVAWQKMSIDDFNIGAAGNFVQVDFVPLVRTERSNRSVTVGDTSTASSEGASSAWQGRPNFKKFRSKDRATRKPIAMDLVQPHDYGTGPRYATQSHISSNGMRSQRETNGITSQKRSIFSVANGDDDDEEEEEEQWPASKQTQSSAKRSTQSRLTQRQPREMDSEDDDDEVGPTPKKKPVIDLHLDIDDSRDMNNDDQMLWDDEVNEPSHKSSGRQSRSKESSRNRESSTVYADSSPSQMKGRNAAKAKGTTRVSPAKRAHSSKVIDEEEDEDDDEDEGFTFRGFKRTRA
ncbi:uncharacterized protein FA14DRAFT_159136 [Meira miltonrushii]|uniref:BRCT domain-containing protein n=1 Tax=Meira miltonrushii TaxID=1280837 RepID=A0A316VHN1_9BASI|nr:uncharacterized protein FA14DRAFT_159136 [Meira miltonrushii]PWN36754.1 hypothetical protein FA14DRAFT_159136 [Meira miltonrushii]